MRTTLALLGCLALVATGRPAVAQLPEGWPSRIEAEVRGQIAERWEISAENVQLSWGAYRSGTPTVDSSIELMGSGRRGHWVVRVTSATGETSTIRLRSGYSTIRAVAGRRLERGIALAPEDVVMRDTVIWNYPTGTSQTALTGWVTHRRIEMGELLSSPAVQPPQVVQAGHRVDLIWNRGPIGLRLTGIAAGSGAVGEDVFVRTESGARLRGTVVGPGLIRLTPAGVRATAGGES